MKTVRYTMSQLTGTGALHKNEINAQLYGEYGFRKGEQVSVRRDSDSVYFSQVSDETFHERQEYMDNMRGYRSVEKGGLA